MTIEKQIQNLLQPHWQELSEWTWDFNMPDSVYYTTSLGGPVSYVPGDDYVIFVTIDRLIKNAPITECLCFPVQYIRECKKWYLQND